MIIFAYNFKHRKTIDFINHCHHEGIQIDLIIAQNKKKLKASNLPFKYKTFQEPIIHPKDLAEKLNIQYCISDHNSDKAATILEDIKPKIGMIAGARIISKEIINKFSLGIINFHPGDIPEIRGLHSILRAIKKNKRIIVTSHLIDSKIDAGNIIEKKEVIINRDDTIFDVSDKTYRTELDLIVSSHNKVSNGHYKKVNIANYPYDSSPPYNSLKNFEEDFEIYKNKIL